MQIDDALHAYLPFLPAVKSSQPQAFMIGHKDTDSFVTNHYLFANISESDYQMETSYLLLQIIYRIQVKHLLPA